MMQALQKQTNKMINNKLKSVTDTCEVHLLSTAFALTWPAAMKIYWNKKKCLHKKRVQLPQDWFGTVTWPPFHCVGTPI